MFAGEAEDVLVIGAGPAGAAAAIVLAQAGRSVRLLERAFAPRPKIGESLTPKIEPLLEILGVRVEVERAGFARMPGTTLIEGGRIESHDFDAEQRRLGYQVDRAVFDGILVARARALGATLEEGVRVVRPSRDDAGRVNGLVVVRGGRRELRPARFVVDASGTAAVLGRSAGLLVREPVRTVALGGYWRGARLPRGYPPSNTLFEMLPEGWIWSLLRSDGLRNVTVGLDGSTFRGGGVRPRDRYHALIASSKLVAPLLEGAALVTELTAHPATASRAERYVGPGFLLAGDAASFVDPLTSQGVYKALQSGITGGAVVNTILERPEAAALAMRYYQDAQARFVESYAELALTFHRKSPFAALPFWAARTESVLVPAPRFDDRAVEEAAARRRRFMDLAHIEGGQRLRVRGRAALALEPQAVPHGGFIVERPALVGRDDGRVVDTPRIDPVALFPLLDGRRLAEVFEGYLEALSLTRSLELARALLHVLANLVERDLLEVVLEA